MQSHVYVRRVNQATNQYCCLLRVFSTLKMEERYVSESPIQSHRGILRDVSEDRTLHTHRCDNIKSNHSLFGEPNEICGRIFVLFSFNASGTHSYHCIVMVKLGENSIDSLEELCTPTVHWWPNLNLIAAWTAGRSDFLVCSQAPLLIQKFLYIAVDLLGCYRQKKKKYSSSEVTQNSRIV